MTVPAAIAFRHAGIIEFPIEPFVRLGVSISEGENRHLPMLVSRVVIHLVGIHVDTKLRTTNTVGMDFAEDKDIR